MRLVLFLLCLCAGNAYAEENKSTENKSAAEEVRTKEDTNREVTRTYARYYFEQKDYVRTENLLSDYLRHDGQDASLWNLLGQAQLHGSRFAQACHAFKKASEVYTSVEDKTYALYNFADCLNRGGKQDEAVKILKRISEQEGGVADIASRTLVDIEQKKIPPGTPLPPYVLSNRRPFRLAGAFGAGFDSNVLLIEEALISGVPVSDRGSTYITPALQLGYLGNLWGENFDSRYLASFTDYLEDIAKSYNSLYQRLDFVWGSGDVRWGVFSDVLFLNRNPFQLYSWDAGVSYNRHYVLSGQSSIDFEMPLRYQKYPLDDALSADNNREGFDLQAKARYRLVTSDKESFTAQLMLDSQYTNGKNYRLLGFGLPLLYITELPGIRNLGILNTFSGEVSGQMYYEAQSGRRDMGLRAGIGLVKRFEGSWNLSLDFGYFKNLSSLQGARYTKNTVALMVSHDFL